MRTLITSFLIWLSFNPAFSQPGDVSKIPFYQLIEHLKISREALQSAAPHLPSPCRDFEKHLNAWIAKYPDEWHAFLKLPAVAAQEINWASYGVHEKYIPPRQEVLQQAHWQWFVAAKVPDEKRLKLFPHFPLAHGMKNTEENIKKYNTMVGIWMRLYPKEYQAFLNTPEIAALVPDRKGDVQLPYMPKFLGAPITSKRPVKKNTGNELMDEYNYQLALRYWTFLYDEAEYNRLYAKDYDFPPGFDVERFKINARAKIHELEKGSLGEDDLKRMASEPAKGNINWTNPNNKEE
ncbi:MAG: hypothetical protein NZM35_07885 [Chitinophagales bacterium]|nr:hypothetical protein [Chitinophagales bacterium]MDW8419203.1 hypothetical protein [Chitinophagales bacterium]